MTCDTPLPFDLPAVRRKKLTVDFGGGNQSSDAGLLLIRESERRLGVCRRLAAAMPDGRDPARVQHAMIELVMARAAAIACGHEDGNDHDRLRHDPLLKLAVGRCPESGEPLASQATYSRLENAPGRIETARLTAALVDQYAAHVDPGGEVVLDYDPNIARSLGKVKPGGLTNFFLWRVFGATRKAPLLVVRGELSDILSARTAERMVKRHPDARLATVPRVGHAPILDERQAVSAITDFLARLEAKS